MWFVQSVNRDTTLDAPFIIFEAEESANKAPFSPESGLLKEMRARLLMPVPNRREALPDPFKPAGTAREEVPISPVQIIILSYWLTCGSCSL